jgi:hypothetical protein
MLDMDARVAPVRRQALGVLAIVLVASVVLCAGLREGLLAGHASGVHRGRALGLREGRAAGVQEGRVLQPGAQLKRGDRRLATRVFKAGYVAGVAGRRAAGRRRRPSRRPR